MDAMTKRLFGLATRKEIYPGYIELGNMTFQNMIAAYNLETFVKDKHTDLSQDDLDTLELFTIISKIQDADTLKDVYKELIIRGDIIKVEDVKELKEKIPHQYAQELVGSLLTFEKAKEMVLKGEEGISYQETEDGFEVISLEGAYFKIIEHSTSFSVDKSNSGLVIPEGISTNKIWKEFEKGCSTISGTLIEANNNMQLAVAGASLSLGFADVPANQIVGMDPTDAGTSHEKRKLNPRFGSSFNYSEEFLRQSAARYRNTHPYNEIVMMRRNTDASGIEDNTAGGKIMPDYIIARDEITSEHKEYAKQFAKDGKPLPILLICQDKYEYNLEERANTYRDNSIEREQGKISRDIEKITKKRKKDIELTENEI